VTGSRLAAGTLPVVTAVTASGVVPWAPASLLPVTGIVLGGAMVATTLATRRMTDELRARAGEYEAALALGFLPREAVLEIARPAAGLALVPGLDQTRTVGLVTLPGAFVGVLLAGGSPAEAGAAQLLVLVGLLAAQSLAVLTTVELVARRRLTTPDLAARLPS
jgi:putative ABC transport system permease protein